MQCFDIAIHYHNETKEKEEAMPQSTELEIVQSEKFINLQFCVQIKWCWWSILEKKKLKNIILLIGLCFLD